MRFAKWILRVISFLIVGFLPVLNNGNVSYDRKVAFERIINETSCTKFYQNIVN